MCYSKSNNFFVFVEKVTKKFSEQKERDVVTKLADFMKILKRKGQK